MERAQVIVSAPDAVIVGAGHNGLVCAAYLARGGLRVLVLEARSGIGGCASTVDALGARVNVCSCDHSLVLATPILEELDLARYGLQYLDVDPLYLFASWDGADPWFLFRDIARTVEGLRLTHPDEAERYARYLKLARPAAELVLEVACSPPLPGRVLRRLLERRGRGVRTIARWGRRSVGDVVRSLFGTEPLRAAAVSTGPAVWGAPPETPGTGLGALIYAMRHATGAGRPRGGSGALPAALGRAVEAAGGTIRTGARAVEILAEGDRVRGVVLQGGEVVEASIVVAAADPRVALVRWLARPPARAAALVRRWEARPEREGYQSKVDALVAAPPRYRALEDGLLERLGVPDPLVPTAIVSPDLEGISVAHRAMGRGEVAARPILFVNVPSALDPTMRAGSADVLSLEALFTPYRLRGGWDDSPEPRRWLDVYGELLQPGFIDGLGPWQAMTPPRYEAEFGLERAFTPAFSGTPLSVLLGRDRELTRYETPVKGLYLTGAGTFPGAGVWGASGRNAATVILSRLGR
jgi:phytoene dehydrogenase-like protein